MEWCAWLATVLINFCLIDFCFVRSFNDFNSIIAFSLCSSILDGASFFEIKSRQSFKEYVAKLPGNLSNSKILLAILVDIISSVSLFPSWFLKLQA